MKDMKLNNLLGMEEFSEKEVMKKNKPTKRTDVAKDVLLEGKEVVAYKELNNLVSLEDFQKTVEPEEVKKTKRTEVAKDILEKKKSECCDDDKKEKEDEKEETPKGLTPGQKKLPEALQKAILAKQKK